MPLWAQRHISDLKTALIELQGKLIKIEQAKEILDNRDWFAINGPTFDDDENSRTLWSLDRDKPHAICSLGQGDVLIVGRHKA